MELKEYALILKKYKKVFFGVWLGFFAVAMLMFFLQKNLFEATLSIDLGRNKVETSQNKEAGYDQFYRLEADDRFSKNIEQWLKDPNVVNAVYAESKISLKNETLGSLSKKFKAEKLAPGYLQVRYAVEDQAQAKKISDAIREQINRKIEVLNPKEENWFEAVFSGPVMAPKKLPWELFFLGGLLGGLLIAFFATLTVFYWQDDKES